LQRLDRAIWGYIEHELYSYKDTKKALEEMREDILNSSPAIETSVQSGPGNPTEAKATKLLTSKVLNRMSKTILAIERALKILSEDHNQLFELKYNQRNDWRMIVILMPTSERTYFRLRSELVYMVAQEMGME
jgi:RinA family phage transcriptional activator